ncbi:MAG: NHL repeat-containing protein [Defluviitaleaceae bacterium]|nr:NHL repeat-containing protein [Defluviitaleaceae bacterium]
MKKFVLFCLIFIFAFPLSVNAVPYRGFTYNYWGGPIPAPVAYVPLSHVNASDICASLGSFNMPQDLHVDINGNIYIADTSNHRIVIFDRHLELINVIDSFYMHGALQTFNFPRGVFVTRDLDIYIADTENRRIVTLDQQGNFLRVNNGPEFGEIDDHFQFFPLKITVDNAGRQFVIVRGVFEGIMRFDPRGNFTGYFGTIQVSVSAIDWFWRLISTAEQRARQQLFIPTEFTGMDIDEYGFVFTTNLATGAGAKVQRLNPAGEDVLHNFTDIEIVGSANYSALGQFSGPSQFIDIVARGNGMYTALDRNRGRLYTYDREGNLLYVFGGTGNVLGMQRIPTALAVLDDTILVLDALRGEITFYEPTELGWLINEAVALLYDGDVTRAVEMWHRVLEIDANFRLALVGVGRAYLAAGENRLAMNYLRRGIDVEYFSIAFRRHRTELMRDNFYLIFFAVVGLAFIKPAVWVVKKVRKKVRPA